MYIYKSGVKTNRAVAALSIRPTHPMPSIIKNFGWEESPSPPANTNGTARPLQRRVCNVRIYNVDYSLRVCLGIVGEKKADASSCNSQLHSSHHSAAPVSCGDGLLFTNPRFFRGRMPLTLAAGRLLWGYLVVRVEGSGHCGDTDLVVEPPAMEDFLDATYPTASSRGGRCCVDMSFGTRKMGEVPLAEKRRMTTTRVWNVPAATWALVDMPGAIATSGGVGSACCGFEGVECCWLELWKWWSWAADCCSQASAAAAELLAAAASLARQAGEAPIEVEAEVHRFVERFETGMESSAMLLRWSYRMWIDVEVLQKRSEAVKAGSPVLSEAMVGRVLPVAKFEDAIWYGYEEGQDGAGGVGFFFCADPLGGRGGMGGRKRDGVDVFGGLAAAGGGGDKRKPEEQGRRTKAKADDSG
ncbi:uncharacterized protein EV422DRAFT_576208 [Fimicolochytrium jonesii]|uniref:uncharacterized protein n=1 Tax=Fimicolochytrium jonesii TaxID=1396493 RepID=UPI0022FDC12F|nr:uncharacterized protein EV422DRAFT_576208 [Fimicolochytrium jonesii]KAI8824975.1 hypothetical protein EV422DRAFT_576208 [Fimicolochytrium jonesii]